MQLTLINVVTALFLANALFWGLGSHQQHCNLAKKVGVECVSHNVHLMMSVVFFLGTITLVHRKHLSKHLPFLKKLN